MSTSTVSPAPGPVPTPAPGNNANTRFNQVLQSSNRNGATYRPASANEKAPALSDYASIEKPGTVAADTVRYVTEKGDHVLVSKSTSPELYQQVVDDQPALAGFKTSVAAGYKPAAADAEAPSGSGGYLRIGPPEEMGPGLIRYEAADGSKVIVSEQQNPELFKQVASDFKTLSGINSSQQEGYRLAGADEKVPEKLGDFAVVGPVDEAGPGLMRYVDREGNKIVVSQSDNPQLYGAAKDAFNSLTGLSKSETEGYRRAGDNEVWPPVFGTTVGPLNEAGPGTLRYEHNGEKVVVARDDNPKLFDYLKALQSVVADPEKRSAMEKAVNEGQILADGNTPLPGLNDIVEFHWIPGQEQSQISYRNQQGETVVVTQALTPDLFEKVTTLHDAWNKINSSREEGYKLAEPNDFLKNQDITIGSPDELGSGLIRFENGDGKFIVSKDASPQLYDDVVEKWNALGTGNISDTRTRYNLPAVADVDLMGQKTGVKADKDDEKSEELNVGELATKELLDQYREGVKKGDIAKDDPRAKLVRAIEAQAAYDNGRGLTGYEEAQGAFGGTWREFDSKQTQLSSADMHDIIDGGKLQEQLTTLFSDPTVQQDYQSKMTEALDKVPNKDEIKQKLLDLTANPDYVLYLKDLKKQGLGQEAQKDLSDTLSSLALVDPEGASKAAQSIQADGLTSDLNDLVADPSKISDENNALATKDLFGLLKAELKGFLVDMPRFLQPTFEKFIQEGVVGNAKPADIAKALKEVGDAYQKNGKVSEDDIKTALSKPYIPVADRGKLGEIFNTLNSKGVMGSVAAGVSLFSAIYQMVGNGGKLGETPIQRLGIAKDFLSFAGGASHFVRLADQVGDLMGKGGLVDMLGLDKTLPEIWGKENFGKTKEVRVSGISASNLSEIRTALDATDDYRLSSTLGDMAGGAEAERQAMGGITQRLSDAVQASGAKLPSATASKIAGSVVKVLGPATDLAGGFADIVLGAFTIKDGVKSGDKLAQAAGGLQIAGGAFGASAGVLGTAALVGAGGAAATALAGPFFLVGVAIAVVGGIIGYFVDHNKKQKASENENDWYRDLAADGLLQADWGDKVEYAHYSIHHYQEREAPADDSLFRFQSAEWQHFDETPQKDGSSTNRLDGELHVEFGETHKTPDQEQRDQLREAPRWTGPKI
ncbi:hypothetical protein [Pseudomonas syringae]|nr:hypothetical protein [Pseudomonas syringae]MCF5466608.1 hypothetical protein [Pseudomonas syringae]MCF5471200.1 hypothetical protein [Pseudomonas syringae]MCF5482505.1 hypothetical protein [Pseudomonas syringae]MCF5486387.1 hypothetical protein [Pseudomonas syringae]MCF5491103.1 hypothetical protein [Pseudomonas syringae]